MLCDITDMKSGGGVDYDTADEFNHLDSAHNATNDPRMSLPTARTTSTFSSGFYLPAPRTLPDENHSTDTRNLNTITNAGEGIHSTQSEAQNIPPPPPPPEYLPSDLPMPMSLEDIAEAANLDGLKMSKDGTIQLRHRATRYVLYCHQPPFKIGCGAFGDDIINLGSSGKLRNCYMCKRCHIKWSQLHPNLLHDGQDPMIGETNRRTETFEAPRSGGYKCTTCKLPKNPSFAQNGMACKCPKKYPAAAPKFTPIPLPSNSSSTSSISSITTEGTLMAEGSALNIDIEQIKKDAMQACAKALLQTNPVPAARPVIALPLAQVSTASASTNDASVVPAAPLTTPASTPASIPASSRKILGLASDDPYLSSVIPFKSTSDTQNLGVFPKRNIAKSAAAADANEAADVEKASKKRGRNNTDHGNRQCRIKKCTHTPTVQSKTDESLSFCFNCKGMLSDRDNKTIRPCVACEDCDEEVAWWCYACARVTQTIMDETPEWRCPTHAK